VKRRENKGRGERVTWTDGNREGKGTGKGRAKTKKRRR
jgi:hypothetical protein